MKLARGREHVDDDDDDDDDEFENADDEYELNSRSSFSLFELSSVCLLLAVIAIVREGVAAALADAIVEEIVDVVAVGAAAPLATT